METGTAASAAKDATGGSVEPMTIGLIICGALGREVVDIVRRRGWDAQVIGVTALDHLYPERIAPDVERRIQALRGQYERLIVVYGDCGSGGMLDSMLARYPEIERIAGPHCYEMYAGKEFDRMMAEQPGTYFLTDFMVRAFRGTILKGMGLDRFPELVGEYFRNYQRVVYLAQTDAPEYREKAQAIADYLGLPLEIRATGYGALETRLAALMEGKTQAAQEAIPNAQANS
jgi:hypothetical protein